MFPLSFFLLCGVGDDDDDFEEKMKEE